MRIEMDTKAGVTFKALKEMTCFDVVAFQNPLDSDNVEQPLFLRGPWDVKNGQCILINLDGAGKKGREHFLEQHEATHLYKVGEVTSMKVEIEQDVWKGMLP